MTKNQTSKSLLIILVLLCSSCAFKGVNRSKDLIYTDSRDFKNTLNVFAPKKSGDHNVLVFIHGGSWNTGDKNKYSFFGNRLARRNIVAVIIDYPLAPDTQVDEMAVASATALAWIKDNIKSYGGDPNQIFVSGHSAGGHLATLISVRPKYFDTLGIDSPIKGTVLIDAGGLDMYGYLKKFKDTEDGKQYIEAFTSSPDNWKALSPKYHLNAEIPPMLFLVGGKTYPSIKSGNEEFFKLVQAQGKDPIYYFQEKKKHVGMMSQFLKTWTPAYKQLFDFMQLQRESSKSSVSSVSDL